MNFTDNILAVYRRASADDILEGLSWYNVAHDIASEAGDVSVGAGILSALSPRMPWKRNVMLARVAFANTRLFRGALGNSIRKTNAILDGVDPLDILKTDKTRSFYMNIVNPNDSNEVTIDTHAIKIAGLDRDSVGKKLYAELADAYRDAAKVAGMLPLDMQAVTWTTYRREQDMWTSKV